MDTASGCPTHQGSKVCKGGGQPFSFLAWLHLVHRGDAYLCKARRGESPRKVRTGQLASAT